MRRFSVSKRFENNVPVTERVRTVARMFGVDINRFTAENAENAEKNNNKKTNSAAPVPGTGVSAPCEIPLEFPGLSPGNLLDFSGCSVVHSCEFEVEDGDIVYITGPSGAGKSVLLREIEKAIPADERINIDEIELPADRAVIDCINRLPIADCQLSIEENKSKIGNPQKLRSNFEDSVPGIQRIPRGRKSAIKTAVFETDRISTIEAMRVLGYAGLSDVFCILTAPANLSEGQKYRYRLACALASLAPVPGTGASRKANIIADEFCSNLDRITAAVIAYNVRRFAKKNGATFFLASSHEDILADLQPDVLVVKGFKGEAEVSYKKIANCRLPIADLK